MKDDWKRNKKRVIFIAKKQELINTKSELILQMNEENMLTKIELIQLMKLIKEVDEMEDDEVFDLDYFLAVGEADDILSEYYSQQLVWFYYLINYLAEEEYELCCDIRDIINIYENKLIALIKKNRKDILANDKDYILKIKGINTILYERTTKKK